MSPTPRLRDCGNWLLDHVPEDEFDRLEPMLKRTSLAMKQVVHQYEAEVELIYFPTTALISLLMVLEEDDPVEAGTVGREGLVGLGAVLGVGTSPHRAICQLPGGSLCLPVVRLEPTLEACPELARLVKRYVAFTVRGTSQTTACNALHTVEARAARWLLMLHDQAGSDEFPLTQEFWAFMLGVRRQSVTVVAGALQNAGLISFRRGVIKVLDRPLLEEAACECYATIRDYYDRIV